MTTPYYVEPFEGPEADTLNTYTTNLDQPVFALTNLPESTKAALFARYSRTPKSLRRVLLDEFLSEEDKVAAVANDQQAGQTKATALFSRVLAEYGDDSVAQLGGVHLACEQASQLLLKALEWGRLMAYLEQSTRYISYSDKRDGFYRYYRDPQILASSFGKRYLATMDNLFDTYTALQEPVQDYLDGVIPPAENQGARKRAIKALSFDILRGLLPAGTTSNLGIFGTPQAYEQLILRLRAHPLPEANAYANLIDQELQKIIPDFLTRVNRPERGGVWVDYLKESAAQLKQLVPTNNTSLEKEANPPLVKLIRFDPQGEDKILAAALFPHSTLSEEELVNYVSTLNQEERNNIFQAAVGDRLNRRHKPGRNFEMPVYTFEVVGDYGAFRDLQRHRMLTIQWQKLSPSLGHHIPKEIFAAGLEAQWNSAVNQADELYQDMLAEFPEQASYLVTLGHSLRYSMTLNAREAMHLIELRTSPQGHINYRQVGLEMHRLIREEAHHHLIADAMKFIAQEDVHLPRYQSEAKAE